MFEERGEENKEGTSALLLKTSILKKGPCNFFSHVFILRDLVCVVIKN